MAFIYGVLKLWEKVDFIGSLEWMMGTLNVYILGIPKKSEQKVKWYRWASRDVKLSNPEWINIFEEDDNDSVQYHNSKLSHQIFHCRNIDLSFHFSRIQEFKNRLNNLKEKININIGLEQ